MKKNINSIVKIAMKFRRKVFDVHKMVFAIVRRANIMRLTAAEYLKSEIPLVTVLFGN